MKIPITLKLCLIIPIAIILDIPYFIATILRITSEFIYSITYRHSIAKEIIDAYKENRLINKKLEKYKTNSIKE